MDHLGYQVVAFCRLSGKGSFSKIIGEQDFVKILCQGYSLLPWQPDFRRRV